MNETKNKARHIDKRMIFDNSLFGIAKEKNRLNKKAIKEIINTKNKCGKLNCNAQKKQ